MRDEYGVEIFLIPFELRPDMPEQGISAKENGLEHSEHVERYLLRVAAEEGVRMTLSDLVPKTHRAIVLSEVARDAGPDVHHAAHLEIFRTYYVDGEDIGDPEVLTRVAERMAGLDPAKVRAAWEDGSMEERVAGFRHVAVHLGVSSTPAALVCNELLIGSRPYGTLADAVAECLAEPAESEGM